MIGTTQWRPLITTVVADYPPLPTDVFEAMVLVESNGNPTARSASDARGLAQLIPRWHRDGVGKQIAAQLGKPLTDALWYDPEFSLRCGARHLRWCFTSDGSRSWERAVRKYFTGTADPPPGFTDGQGTTPDQHITKLRAALATVRADMATNHPPEEEPPMVKPYILLVSGHRSTRDPGNPVERELTDNLAIAYQRVFQAAGYRCDWLQEDLDGDSLPTMTVGSLATVASVANRALAAAKEPMAIMLDLHYNMARSAIHTIVPDWVGDSAAMNILDVALAKAISLEIYNANQGMSLYKGRLNITGVMSEKETNVYLQHKARLGMFNLTAGQRRKAVRLVVEHGGTNDASRFDFYNRCANAALKAVRDVFPTVGTDPNPVPVPVEPPAEERPDVVYPAWMTEAVAATLFGTINQYAFDPRGPVSNLWLANGKETGRFPSLVAQGANGSVKYFAFSDGMVIMQPSPSEALRIVEPAVEAAQAA